MLKIWRNMWLWELEERSTERSGVRVVIYTLLPIDPGTWNNSELSLYKLWDFKNVRAAPPVYYIGSGTEKSECESSYIPFSGPGTWKILKLHVLSMLWDLKERSNGRREVRVVVYNFLPSEGPGTWRNSERSLEARLERHETRSLFCNLVNKS